MAAKFSLLLAVKTLGAQGIKRLGNSMQGLAGKVKNAKLTFDGLAKAYASLRVVQDTVNKSVQREESVRRLNLLAQGYDDLAAVQNAAANAANKFGTSQTIANKEFAQIYARLRPIGLELNEIVSVYEGFNTAAKLSGTSATEASGAFLQLSQALGTGVLRGQELNSVFEQTPAVVQAIAKEMGVTVGEIRDLAKEGKVTIDYILPALERLRTEGAEKLTEAMKGPAQQFRNLNIAVEELQIAAIEDNLEKIIAVIQRLTETTKTLTNIINAPGFKTTLELLYRFSSGPLNKLNDIGNVLESKDPPSLSNQLNIENPEQTGGFIGRYRDRVDDLNTSLVETTNKAKEVGNSLVKTFGENGKKKIEDYVKSLNDVGSKMADVVINGIKGMEDALVDFVMTGKLNFKDLANSIIKDMARIAIQQSITDPLTGWFKGLFSAKGNVLQNGQHLTAFAKGGVIDSPHFKYMANGGIAVAGEGSGAEAILPLTRRNGVLGVEGGGGTNVVVNVDASGTEVQGDEQQGRALGQLIAAAVQSELVQQSRPGGILNPA